MSEKLLAIGVPSVFRLSGNIVKTHAQLPDASRRCHGGLARWPSHCSNRRRRPQGHAARQQRQGKAAEGREGQARHPMAEARPGRPRASPEGRAGAAARDFAGGQGKVALPGNHTVYPAVRPSQEYCMVKSMVNEGTNAEVVSAVCQKIHELRRFIAKARHERVLSDVDNLLAVACSNCEQVLQSAEIDPAP
jgi:hypothetical protein